MGPVRFDAGCQAVSTLDGTPEVRASVRWLGPAAPDEISTLTAWCARVGPALVDAEGRDPPAEPVNRIAVISWNVHLGRGDLARLLDELRSGQLTGGESVTDFVVLLQEAVRVHAPSTARSRGGEGGGGDETHGDIADWGREFGLAVFYAPSMPNDQLRPGKPAADRGNAILSTLPLADLRVIDLPFERQRRAALGATVQLPAGPGQGDTFRVVTVHLDVWPALVPSLLDPTRRFRQAEGLLEIAGADSMPLVLGGDFNTASVRDPLITSLRTRFPESVLPSSCRTKYRFCPDYIFQRLAPVWNATPYRILEGTYGSDHRPLIMLMSRAAAVHSPSVAQ